LGVFLRTSCSLLWQQPSIRPIDPHHWRVRCKTEPPIEWLWQLCSCKRQIASRKWFGPACNFSPPDERPRWRRLLDWVAMEWDPEWEWEWVVKGEWGKGDHPGSRRHLSVFNCHCGECDPGSPLASSSFFLPCLVYRT